MKPSRKRIVLKILLTALLARAAGASGNPLTVYTYDSFAGKDSLGALLQSGSETRYITFPSAGEALNQIALEGKATAADLLVGVDQSLLARAKALGAFEEFRPFDYGYLTFVYDDRRAPKLPSPLSLRALARAPGLRHRVAIEDPRASSIGLAFLLWTHLLYDKKGCDAFWKDLWGTIVTVAPGWSAAYGLFLKRGADLVVSYTTSPAYHRAIEKNNHFHALIFPEGNYRQVEEAAVVKYSRQPELARRWLARLLSPEIQARLPEKQWMYPVRSDVKLPPSFAGLPVPKALDMEPERIEKERQAWLRQWQASSMETK